MRAFQTYHPIVNFVYFVLVIAFSMCFLHPACLAISLLCSVVSMVLQKGRGAMRFQLLYMLPLLLCSAVINPAFNHEGMTILAYLPSGNPLTLESILYGVAAAVLLVSVISWFSCFNTVMTSDKFVYLFGRLIPSMSLIFSMVLRFVPLFQAQAKAISRAQRCVGRDISNGSLWQRAKHGLTILSILVTWALENAVETADSMKSRGYGLPGRTAFSIYVFDRRDAAALACIGVLGVYVIAGSLLGGMSFQYFPSLASAGITPYRMSVFGAYFVLCSMPIFFELREGRTWNAIASNI